MEVPSVEVKEEILSEDETSNDNDCEPSEIHSCFIKEDYASTFQFKEELDYDSDNMLHETTNLSSDPLESECYEFTQVMIKIDHMEKSNIYEDEDTIHRNNEKKHRRHINPFSSDTKKTINTIVKVDKHSQIRSMSKRSKKKSEDTFTCSQCGHIFKSLKRLQSHKWRICNSNNFECAICGHRLKYKKNLIAHIQRHAQSAELKCKFCDKTFLRKYRLTLHEKSHIIPPAYTCDECGASFADKRYLISHKRIHSDERPFVCSVCNKSFKQKAIMMAHMLVHLDDKCELKSSFDCKICSESFSRKNDLRKHERAHAYQQYNFNLCKNVRFKRTR